MDSRQFASAFALSTAAEFVRANLPQPTAEVVGVAVIEDAGVRVVVSITRYDGPTTIHLTPLGAKELGLPMPLTNLQRKVLDVLDATPKKGAWIASKIGAKYDGNFRAMLAKMVKLKLIEKRDGYARPAITSTDSSH